MKVRQDVDVGCCACYYCSHLVGEQPHRVRMAHSLIESYDLYQRMEVFVRELAGCHMYDH